ncbi:hypothetical protein HON22_06105, partial [Candidatus Peregrinibacteria bacterium]|nr:hypothetical protein [Candidatus Peregrinibacteria bacterium]
KASENGIYWDDGNWRINRNYQWDTSFNSMESRGSILGLKSLTSQIDIEDPQKLEIIKNILKK